MKTLILIPVLLLAGACQKTSPWHTGQHFVVQKENGQFTTWLIDSISKKHIWYIESDFSVDDSIYLDSLTSFRLYTDLPSKTSRKQFAGRILQPWKPNK